MRPNTPRELVPGHLTRIEAVEWVHEADRVFIGAGAGLSAAAGFDYTDQARFAELFPALRKLGFRARYELIGQPLPPGLQWGFWAVHTADIRFGKELSPLYRSLRELVGERDCFVLSSNVDQLFIRNGFDPGQQFTPQGDYGLYQCLTPCTRQVWESEPIIRRALESYDETTGETSAVPVCPNCGGPVSLNVYAGSWYINDHFLPGAEAANTWLADAARRNEKVAVIEFGAGFNTPAVVRWPVEDIVGTLPNARLIRINPGHPGVPERIAGISASFPMGAGEAIGMLADG